MDSSPAEGDKIMAYIGIGDEIVWLCPTLSDTNGADDITGNGLDGTVVDASVVADTSNGGTHAYDFQAESHRIEYGALQKLYLRLMTLASLLG